MQDNKQSANQPPASGSLVPDIVKEIPVAAPDAKARPVNEDDELDKIMRDVGQDLKKVGQKNPRHHWFSRQNKTEPEFSARPVVPAKPVPAAPAPQPNNQPTKLTQTAKTQPIKTSRAPVGVVVLAMLITCGLIAAAYYAYK